MARALFAFWLWLCAIISAQAQDVFLKNANGYTFAGDTLVRFEALLVRDGKVTATGAPVLLEPYAKPGTIRDLQGKTVLPGLSSAYFALSQRAQMRCAARPGDTLEACLLAVMNDAAASGITLVQDPATNIDSWTALRALEDKGQLPVRVYASIDAHAPSYEAMLDMQVYVGTYKHMLALRSIGWRQNNPALRCEASTRLGASGYDRTYPPLKPVALRNRIARAVMRGYQVRLGSAGSRAAEESFAALEDVLGLTGRPSRHMVMPVIRPKDPFVQRLKATQIALGFAPCLSSAAQARQLDRAFFDELIAEGADVVLAGNNPAQTIAAFARTGSAQAKAALKASTSKAAHAAYWDKYTGSLDAGRWADFVILDADIMDGKVPGKVLETWVAGRQVFKR